MIAADHDRLEQIQEALGKYDLDALVLFHTDNILMATGMFPGSTHVVALVTAEKQVVIITPWWRERFVQEEGWANQILSYDWCRGFNGVEPTSAVISLLRKCKEIIGLEKIGYDARMHHYNPTKIPSEFFTYEGIKCKLPEIFGVAEDATEIINELKSVKTAREVEKLRLANAVARAGVQAFYETARAGLQETDLAAEVNYAILKMAGRQGIRYTYCDPPQITSGPERTAIADTLSNHATERMLQEGDLVMLEFGVLADGYWADITRNLVVGGPREDHLRIHKAILQAQEDAMAAYVPNRSTGHELCEFAWEAMRSAGFGTGITHFLGHGLGFAYHEDRPILGPGERAVIRPGQVTSLEPGLYWKDNGSFVGGIRVEDNVLWGNEAGQVEILSEFYRGLDSKEW
jgi:Xaa-Pro aminopeptidase